jgi:hypothetical protein
MANPQGFTVATIPAANASARRAVTERETARADNIIAECRGCDLP